MGGLATPGHDVVGGALGLVAVQGQDRDQLAKLGLALGIEIGYVVHDEVSLADFDVVAVRDEADEVDATTCWSRRH